MFASSVLDAAREQLLTAHSLSTLSTQAAAFVLFAVLHFASRPLFTATSSTYRTLLHGDKTRGVAKRPWLATNWDSRIGSTVHAFAICAACVSVAADADEFGRLSADRVGASSARLSWWVAFSCGYFLWDTVACLVWSRVFGIAFLVHGLFCWLTFMCVNAPFVQWHAVVFLMFEASTPFINAVWVMKQCGTTDSVVYKACGALSVLAFFVVRLAFGSYISFTFMGDMYTSPLAAERWLLRGFLVPSNIVMNLLNLHWFSAIVAYVRAGARKPAPSARVDATK